MSTSIFHSRPVPSWAKTSKALDRLDVEEEEDVNERAQELLKQGHAIHAIMPNYKTPDQAHKGKKA